jgi:hypothetical protein
MRSAIDADQFRNFGNSRKQSMASLKAGNGMEMSLGRLLSARKMRLTISV